MSNEYPRDFELERIEKWDVLKDGAVPLLEYIRELWWQPEWGFVLKGKRVLQLELHTGGWSGNESIVEVLQSNIMFWILYWQKSTRGGHYWFRIEGMSPQKKTREGAR